MTRSPMYTWIEEVEGFSSRWERLLEEYESGLLVPTRIIQWFEAAYAAGYNDARNENETISYPGLSN